MKREKQLKSRLEDIIAEGRRPSIQLLSQEMDWTVEDVHSVVNSLEKKKEVETYVKEVLGKKVRLVSLKR
ncbi:MAG: hypothetical protein ACLFTA_03645 [Candidatus Nanohaloarchaea archaeon]